MQIYRIETEKFKIERSAVALGRFDAMHRGHMQIIGKAVEYAKIKGIPSLVYMFENEPSEVISGKTVKSVNTLERRLKILKDAGVDIAVVHRFDRKVMDMPREEFVNHYLRDIFGAEFVAVGFNYCFGKNASGDAEYLKSECEKLGMTLHVETEVSDLIGTVSSTRIRELIAKRQVGDAAKLMERFFSVSGKVVKGSHIGSDKIGFPTANIVIPQDCVVPGDGVYITVTDVWGSKYPSITNVGAKPTVGDDIPLIETHICGTFGELYGENIEIEFCEYIRDIKKFDNLDELAKQLEYDKNKSVKFYRSNYNGGVQNEQ